MISRTELPTGYRGPGAARHIDGHSPFVLLDDARDGDAAAPARLLTQPTAILSATDPADMSSAIDVLKHWVAQGRHVAGFLGFEAGYALEPGLTPTLSAPDHAAPLLWFASFDAVDILPADEVANWLPGADGAWIGPVEPELDFPRYAAAMGGILDHIRAGDIYQANLTFAARVRCAGHPLAVYARLRSRARAGYGGVVFTGSHWLLSFSPELFFSLRAGHILARPMKGTAARQSDPAADRAAMRLLESDPKQRAENLMIVDLIRNDLSRISCPGSVTVPALFRIESYPTIHQMVSDVEATLVQGIDGVDVLARMFPCGSITGAPKISAMRIVRQNEVSQRGPYTGSIGFFGPSGQAAFNVAIRTLVLPVGGACASLGLGSGIVADSDALSEWQECLAKGEFVRAAGRDFDLIETMAFDPLDGIVRLDRHLARMGESARLFGFSFDRHRLRNLLQHASFRLSTPARLRLRLSRRGTAAVSTDPAPDMPDTPVLVATAPLPVDTSDFRLQHKTSDRAFYDDARHNAGTFDVVFVDGDGFVTEGSFTTVFVERDGHLLTPRLTRGVLPGVLRSELIDSGRAIEADIRLVDLADGFFLGNSLRGMIAARLA